MATEEDMLQAHSPTWAQDSFPLGTVYSKSCRPITSRACEAETYYIMGQGARRHMTAKGCSMQLSV